MSKKNKIDLDQIDLDKLKDLSVENPGLISFPHTLGSALVKPEDKGRIKGLAMAAMEEQTTTQLRQLYDQMKVLAEQAQAIKSRVQVSERVYQAQINFNPVIGKEYFLYKKSSGKDVLSMIAPEEWGKTIPYDKFVAKIKLLSDHTWEVFSK